MVHQSTVAAVSTPYGRGGIATIRISGEDAVSIAEKIFIAGNGTPLSALAPNQMVWGKILYEGEQIDDGMAVVFRAPHSYTGEDTVEISCHGGILLTQKVLESAFLAGCAPAGAGEFTKRAFLNGKLGLSQAEAIIDLIDAESMEKIRMAGAGARGALQKAAEQIVAELRRAVSSTYAYIDFPDEDLTDMSTDDLLSVVLAAEERLHALARSYTAGHAINEGIRCAIVGKPNTGKSSLLNALIGRDRAIVTDIAGTTRDTLEESVTVGKILLRISDTAGIRGTEDTVEKLGVERSIAAMEEAELILAVFDASRPLDAEDEDLARRLCTLSVPVIAIINKEDIADAAAFSLDTLSVPFVHTLYMSAKNGAGLDALKDIIQSLFIEGEIDYAKDGVVANARQYAAVCAAREHIAAARVALTEGFTQDIAGMDIELALSALGEIDGRTVTSDIVDDIFHNFCVGK